jgi:hypothetical protein
MQDTVYGRQKRYTFTAKKNKTPLGQLGKDNIKRIAKQK